jgi:hypothetical protein
MHYDYTHKNIHYGYNSCATYIKQLEDGTVVSDGIPEKHRVIVLHYWDKKPWDCVKESISYKIYLRLLH